jgi:Flp pilus assembly protein TadB
MEQAHRQGRSHHEHERNGGEAMILAIFLVALIICAVISWLGKRAYHPITTAMLIAFALFEWVFTRFPRKESTHV